MSAALAGVVAVALPAPARAGPWEIRGSSPLTEAAGAVAQRLELADLDADGFVDLVIVNSSGFELGTAADAQRNQVLLNLGGLAFAELAGVFPEPDNAFAVQAADVDGDGDLDLVVGVNFGGESYLLLQDDGAFTREPLAAGEVRVGDLELGDVDGDGDLDILAADWGANLPYGDVDDPGGPLRLWLGDGAGGFTEAAAQLPAGALASWSFDVELVDLDNDFDLDALVATRGPGPALALRNDGTGGFSELAIPALQPMNGKAVNPAFTPVDLDLDGFLDLVTLQDGGPGCVIIEGSEHCGKRDAALRNDAGALVDDPKLWPIPANPPRLDDDAVTLDIDNDGDPDLVVAGERLGDVLAPARLLLVTDGALTIAAPPNDIPLPVTSELDAISSMQVADFDHDRRDDLAIAQRDADRPNFVLFARTGDPEGVPEDAAPPRIGPHEAPPAALYYGQAVTLRARVHDNKATAAWHDWQHDPALEGLDLAPGSVVAGDRRLPYVEFALGLAHPTDLEGLADGDPGKFIAPGVWIGEHLWRARFEVPYGGAGDDALSWRWCAIDAAGNRSCTAAQQAGAAIDPAACGDGVVQAWEACDDALADVPCARCVTTCGDGVCDDPGESAVNCPADCGACGDATCADDESHATCPEDCPDDPTGGGPGICGDDLCAPGEVCPADCDADSSSGSGSAGVGDGGVDILPPDGCLCRAGDPGGSFALLGLLLLRRRRRGA